MELLQANMPVSSILSDVQSNRYPTWIQAHLDIANLEIDVMVAPFNAVGDGVTDDTAAIQAALDAAPHNAIIILGNHRLHGVLTITKHVTLRGSSYVNGNDSVGNSILSRLYFDTAKAIYITATANVSVEYLIVTGSNSGIGLSIAGFSLVLDHATIQAFGTGAAVANGYFCKLVDSYIGYCNYGLTFDNCYNVHMSGMMLHAIITNITATNSSFIRMFGGSVETFNTCGVSLLTGSSLDCFGTYFEGHSGVSGAGKSIQVTGSGSSVVVIGCHIYLTDCGYFIDASTATNFRLFSRTHRIVYPLNAFAVRVYANLASDAGTHIDIEGDNWQNPIGSDIGYTTINSSPTAGLYRIRFPVTHPSSGLDITNIPDIRSLSFGAPATKMDGVLILARNQGFAGDDPAGIQPNYGYGNYSTIWNAGKAQWEIVGVRMPNQINSVAADVATLKNDFNSLLLKMRQAGILV